MRAPKKRVTQTHHISYGSDTEPEITVKMYKGEHWAITQLQRRRYISKGFITALMAWIDEVKDSLGLDDLEELE